MASSHTPGGFTALRLTDGSIAWQMPPQPLLCGEQARVAAPARARRPRRFPARCSAAAWTAACAPMPPSDGKILWTFDTNRSFDTVNGVKANGGSMDGPGAVVAGGMLFVNSGYGGLVGRPGNVLLAFGLE